jgi:lactoylglutathione lyase
VASGLPTVGWAISSAGFVNLYTSDIEAGIRFYEGHLGFVETYRTPTEGVPSHVEFHRDGFALGLGTVEAARSVHGIDAMPGSPAMAIVIWVEDVDQTFQDLRSAGVPVVQDPHGAGNDNRAALVRDPDGNLVEIVSRNS